ncbi:hypothetical protein ACMGE9_05675 [Macrococcus sp. EM39E]|uniref:hypothetical protein n=1 Tax=Macrococcus animalis TaxID=3395467 RepID=UPI0039BE86E3
METLVISFSSKDVVSVNGLDERVPDVLLIKAWYASVHNVKRKDSHHAKQLIARNEVVTNKEYCVEIKLIDERTIKHFDQYTYEMSYFLEGVLKATVISTYLEEVSYAVSNH